MLTGAPAVAAPVTGTQAQSATEAESIWCRYEVTADVLNVRAQPTLDGRVQYQLKRGDVVWGSTSTVDVGKHTWRNLNYSGTQSQWAVTTFLESRTGECNFR
jgi:uncharacterized protein YgiM (DUF1202 family)